MKAFIYLIIAISLLAACKKSHKANTESGARSPEVLVNTPRQQEVIYTYEYPAYLEALQTVNLVARVSGFLEKMDYEPGQAVKAGKLLFVIEPQPYQDQLDAAEAQMTSMEAKLAYAKAQYEKMKEAMPSRAISEIDFIQAESDYHSAVANIQDAKAQLNSARTNLTYCYIKAPFDGRVSRNLVDVKNFINGSVQPLTLATMYRDKMMYAYLNMAYAEYQNLPTIASPGTRPDSNMLLTVINAANPSKKWYGQLDYTSPDVDLQTGTVTVRAAVENAREELLSGMYVKIHVPYKKVPNALLIPETSIATGQSGRYVYLVGKDNRVVQQTVKVGTLTPEGLREIVSGVTPDSRYVVEALMTVRPGMVITPVTTKQIANH